MDDSDPEIDKIVVALWEHIQTNSSWRMRRDYKQRLRKVSKDQNRSSEERQKVLREVRLLIDMAESAMLLPKAERLGVEIPRDKKDCWYRADQLPTWLLDGILNQAGQNYARKVIREERRKNLEWWVKILTPIVALVVSALGLLVALASMARR